MNITPSQTEKIETIAKNYSLKLVLLFGSQVSQFTHKESDFDIAYLSEKELGFKDEYHLNYEFTKVFGSERIDTLDLKRASPLLMQQIFQNHQILFCSNQKSYHFYKIYAYKRFIEATPLFQLRNELIKNYFTANP